MRNKVWLVYKIYLICVFVLDIIYGVGVGIFMYMYMNNVLDVMTGAVGVAMMIVNAFILLLNIFIMVFGVLILIKNRSGKKQ